MGILSLSSIQVTTETQTNSKQKFRCYMTRSFPETNVSVLLTSGVQHPLPETLCNLLPSQASVTFPAQLVLVVPDGHSAAICGSPGTPHDASLAVSCVGLYLDVVAGKKPLPRKF